MGTKLVNITEKPSESDLLRKEVSTKTASTSKPNSFMDRVKRLRDKIRGKDQSVEVSFNNVPDWVDFKKDSWSKWDKYD